MSDQYPIIRNMYKQLNSVDKPVLANLQLDFIDQIASLFSVGSFYYFIFDFASFQFEYVHPNIKKVLGLEPKELTFDKYFEIMHPDNLKVYEKKERAVGEFLLNKIKPEDIPKYKVVYLYKLKNNEGVYRTILHQVRALTVSKDGKIQQVLTIQTDITHLKPQLDHNFSLISNTLPSYYSIDTGIGYELVKNNFKNLFTKREKEVIKLISQGLNFKEIASEMHISPATINTHKRNILQKSDCKNTAQLITRCIREGVI